MNLQTLRNAVVGYNRLAEDKIPTATSGALVKNGLRAA